MGTASTSCLLFIIFPFFNIMVSGAAILFVPATNSSVGGPSKVSSFMLLLAASDSLQILNRL